MKEIKIEVIPKTVGYNLKTTNSTVAYIGRSVSIKEGIYIVELRAKSRGAVQLVVLNPKHFLFYEQEVFTADIYPETYLKINLQVK